MSNSKVWFHVAAPCHNCGWLEEMFDRLEAAGVGFGVYSALDGGLVGTAARYGKAVTIVYRDLAWDYVPYHVIPDAAKGAAYWRQIEDALPPEVKANKGRAWVEVFNEPSKEQPEDVARWQFYLAQAAVAQGFRFCGPGWASGTPEPEAWRGTWMRRYLELCAAQPERVALTLHEYSYDVDDIEAGRAKDGSRWMVGRFEHLHKACDEMGVRRPTIIITECGWAHNDMPPLGKAISDVAVLISIYGPHANILEAYLWTLTGGGDKVQLGADLNALMPAVVELALARVGGTTPPPPTGQHMAVVVKLPQEGTVEEWLRAAEYAFPFRHTMTASHDDMLTVLRGGNAQSYVKLAWPGRESQVFAAGVLQAAGFRWEPLFEEAPAFRFEVWPVAGPVGITQTFGANPANYEPYGLPGHEGVDLKAALRAVVRAVAPGTVSAIGTTGNYGNSARVAHASGWTTIYAHLDGFAAGLQVGDVVAAGQTLGYAGSTGNSTGVHLHLSLKREGMVYTAPGGVVWPFNLHDPTPYLEPFLPAAVDLLSYLRGDGRSYRVTNADGGSEVFQSQWEGNQFYQVKAWGDLSVVNWEGFVVDEQHIRRDVDTSPGGGRYYRQSAGSGPGAPWVKRRMVAGERFTQGKRVQFYRLSDCAPLALYSGDVTDTITFVALHPTYAFRTGVRLADVVELRWEQGGERYFYARGFGLVAWERAHQDPNSPVWSAIAEMRPDVGKLTRLRIGCL